MGLFKRDVEVVISPESIETDNVEVPMHLEICIPEGLVTSDSILAGLNFDSTVKSIYGKGLAEGVVLKHIYWLQQSKTFEDGNSKKIDKYAIEITVLGKQLYFMSDIFFIAEDSCYVIKVLGSYASIAKLLNANFKHKGELVGEKTLDMMIPMTSILSSTKFERRASVLYFWMELNNLSR
jgi:hypothetical protein